MFEDLFALNHGNFVSTDQWYEDDNIADLVKNRFTAYLKTSSADADKLLEKIGVTGLDFSESTYENGILTVKVTYTQNYIFNAGNLTSFQRTLCVQVKMFEYKS
jgi:ubiquitin-protein ligase